MRAPAFVLCNGLLGISLIHAGWVTRPVESPPAPARVAAESGLVIVPSATTVLTLLERELSLNSVRPGDSIYVRVASSVRVDTQTVIPTGSIIQATVSSVVEHSALARRFELTIRFRRLIKPGGTVGDVFVIARPPDDSAYRRGALAVAEVALASGQGNVLPRGSTLSLVMRSSFTVDARRLIASASYGKRRHSARGPV